MLRRYEARQTNIKSKRKRSNGAEFFGLRLVKSYEYGYETACSGLTDSVRMMFLRTGRFCVRTNVKFNPNRARKMPCVLP